jgi:hypothetical protein
MADQAPLPPSHPGLRLADVSWRRQGCWLPAGCINRSHTSDSGCTSATGQPHTCTARQLLTGPRRPTQPFSWWAFGSASYAGMAMTCSAP